MLQGELSLFAKKYNKLYVCCMGRMVVLRRSVFLVFVEIEYYFMFSPKC